MTTKVCYKCGKEQPVENFYYRSNHTERRNDCKECVVESSRLWRVAHAERYRQMDKNRHVRSRDKRLEKERNCYKKYPHRHREKHLIKTFGMTQEEFNKIAATQGNVCAICGRPPANTTRYNRHLRVDHAHTTGAIRGLLCNKCNLMLGLVNDSPTVLASAIEYLKKHK